MQILHEDTKVKVACRVDTWDSSFLPFHWHDNIEICYMCNQSGSFVIEGDLVRAEVGDVVVMGERAVHRFCMDKSDTRIGLMQISPKILLSSASAIKPLKTHITSEEIAKIPYLKEHLATLFDMILPAGRSGAMDHKPYIQTAAATVYFLLMEHFPGEVHTGAAKERQMFYDIAEFVNCHFAENISVQSVASALYIPRGKVGAVFARYAGTTLSEYINAMRINKVNELLKSAKNIAEAAYESGFQNIRTFNAVYKKTMGITPGEYIKNL